jgi:hypothetical protein
VLRQYHLDMHVVLPQYHLFHSLVFHVMHSLVERTSLAQNSVHGFKCFCVRNSAMWVTLLVFHSSSPYHFHRRSHVGNTCWHLICRNVRHFDNPTVQHNMAAATSPDSVQAGIRSSCSFTSASLDNGVQTRYSSLDFSFALNDL